MTFLVALEINVSLVKAYYLRILVELRYSYFEALAAATTTPTSSTTEASTAATVASTVAPTERSTERSTVSISASEATAIASSEATTIAEAATVAGSVLLALGKLNCHGLTEHVATILRLNRLLLIG
jgi:hypothetical protein